MNVEVMHIPALTINAPEWFEDEEFSSWLNSEDCTVMTWHQRGDSPGAWSDVVTWVDPSLNGEGPEQDEMPDSQWNSIVEQCRAHFAPSQGPHILVRITNLQE